MGIWYLGKVEIAELVSSVDWEEKLFFLGGGNGICGRFARVRGF